MKSLFRDLSAFLSFWRTSLVLACVLLFGCSAIAWAGSVIGTKDADIVNYTLRISADEPVAGLLEDCLNSRLQQKGPLRPSETDFQYFLSLVAMPIVQDATGEVLGYSVSTLTISPLNTEAILQAVDSEEAQNVASMLTRAHNLLDWKLYIIKRQNLSRQCETMANDMIQAVDAEEQRLRQNLKP